MNVMHPDLMHLNHQRAADLVRIEAAERRQRCLIELGGQLRRCDSAGQISAAVAAILGRVLHCSRTGYALIDGSNALVENDWTDGSVASLNGRHEFSSLGRRYISHIESGELLVVPDIRSHPVIADSVECWPRIGVQALLNVPLLDKGRTVAMLYAHASSPRDWTGEEIALVREVADRAWEAMGRARAVEALSRMNETLETQVRERTLQRDRMWTLSADMMMVSNRAGIILAVNPAWTRVLGWSESELVGARFFDFIHPEDVERTRAERRMLEQGGTIHSFENRYRAKDGAVVWLAWKAVPDGDIVHSVARDITAEREQAEALQATEEALRHAQKMEAVGQLTGGIAHDFNNLLTGILGSLELAQRRIEQGRIEGIAEYHALARQSAERASVLTQRLLAFSRRQPLDPKPVRANQLILAMEPLLRHTLGEAIRLDLDLAPDLRPVRCDPNQLDSAILNLAINARDAMPAGGTLLIRASNLDEDNKICIAVTDTGTGMPPDVVARAFDPFYTTKPIGQGTGLGLSMVYGFMRQSGGEARIASAVGAGTTISLTLPRHIGEDNMEPATPARLSLSPPSGRGTVVVVEDDPVVRMIIVEVLQDLGFDVLEAADGPSGLNFIEATAAIDLLITDIGLPGLNGRQLAEAARLTHPTLKIMFMTGYAEVAAMPHGFLAPGMELITKPFAIENLATKIQHLTSG